MTIPGGIKSKASSKFTVDCWVGDEKAFLKLIETCRQTMDDAARRAKTALRDRRSLERAGWMSEHSYISDDSRRIETWEMGISEDLDLIQQALQVRLTAIHNKFNQEVTGAPEQVLASLDLADLKKVNIGGGHLYFGVDNQGFGLEVAFSSKDGCEVSLQSPDSDWIMLANEKLRVALIGKRPWYWWLRRYRAVLPLAAIPLLALTAALAMALEKSHAITLLGALSGPIIVILVWGVFGIGQVVRRLLPAFELVESGGSGMGKRNLSLAGTAIAWLIATVLPLFVKF